MKTNIANLIASISTFHPTVLGAGCMCEIPTNFDWSETRLLAEKIAGEFDLTVDYPYGDREKSSSEVGCHSPIAQEFIMAYWRKHQIPVPKVIFGNAKVFVLPSEDRIATPGMALTEESHSKLLEEVSNLLPHFTVSGQTWW